MTDLKKVEIKRVYPPTPTGTAILIGNDEKTFLIFIGFYEATALLREMRKEPAARPLTHDLIQSLLLGFDLTIKQIIISDIVDNAFCATLILEQKINESDGAWSGRRNEVRIDARPSDCLVLAMKNGTELLVTDDVFEQVQDFSHLLDEEGGCQPNDPELEELFQRSRGDSFDEDFSLGGFSESADEGDEPEEEDQT